MIISLVRIEEKDIINGHFECPQDIHTIEASAYSEPCKSKLSSLSLPHGLTYIKEGAFADCKNLEELHLPSTVKHIGSHAFTGCTSLRKIHLPEQLCFIGNNAFKGCSALEEIIFPKKQKLSYLMHALWNHCPEKKYLYFWGEDVFLHCTSISKETQEKLLACENNVLKGVDEWKTYLDSWVDYKTQSYTGIIDPDWIFSVLQKDMNVECIADLVQLTKVQLLKTKLSRKYFFLLFASMEDNGLCFSDLP